MVKNGELQSEKKGGKEEEEGEIDCMDLVGCASEL